MIYLEPSNNHEILGDIIYEPCLQAAHDHPLISNSNSYLLIKLGTSILGCFQTREFTNQIFEAHIYLLPEYWGSPLKYSTRSCEALFEWVKCNTSYTSVITDVPESCTHVIDLMNKLDCHRVGTVEDGVIYNNKLMGLHLFSKRIIRD